MNAYRIALITCHAVVVALWWSAGLRLLSLAITAVFAVFGSGALAGFSLAGLSFQPVINVVLLAIAAGFLQIFAASLAASMTGGGAFEGDSIASSRTLDATERALGRAGGGLFLLFFGATIVIPGIISGAYALLFGGAGFGTGRTASVALFFLVRDLVPALLQCLAGFMLAFALGLRRVVDPQAMSKFDE